MEAKIFQAKEKNLWMERLTFVVCCRGPAELPGGGAVLVLVASFGGVLLEAAGADADSCKLDKSPRFIGIDIDVVDDEEGPDAPAGAVPNT